MKAIINDNITVPFYQIEDGYVSQRIVNGAEIYGYQVILRCPHSNQIFNSLKNLQENNIDINKIEYFNEIEELVGTITLPLIIKEVFRVVNNNTNLIIAKFYPKEEDINE